MAAEERSWTCESCSVMIEPGIDTTHCRNCASYWEDCQNGLYDDRRLEDPAQ